MAHELTMTNGAAEMAYVGKTPWHGLGQNLELGATIEQWKEAAGMAWRIESSPVRFKLDGAEGEAPTFSTMKDRKVLLRSDNFEPLSVVSNQFKPVQPGEVLEFFRDLTDNAGFTLETAGTLFGGRRMWALAKTNAEAAVADARDKVRNYLLLSTACDGTLATEARFTSIRVVCNNTLSWAVKTDSKAGRVKVLHRSHFDAAAVKTELGVEQAEEQFKETMKIFRELADAPLLPSAAVLQTAELMRPGALDLEMAELEKVVASRPLKRVVELAARSQGLIGSDFEGGERTQWAWLNAVTQFVDHESRARSQDNRLNSAWFGNGDTIKRRAADIASGAASGDRVFAHDEASRLLVAALS